MLLFCLFQGSGYPGSMLCPLLEMSLFFVIVFFIPNFHQHQSSLHVQRLKASVVESSPEPVQSSAPQHSHGVGGIKLPNASHSTPPARQCDALPSARRVPQPGAGAVAAAGAVGRADVPGEAGHGGVRGAGGEGEAAAGHRAETPGPRPPIHLTPVWPCQGYFLRSKFKGFSRHFFFFLRRL